LVKGGFAALRESGVAIIVNPIGVNFLCAPTLTIGVLIIPVPRS
jgi:hypothetical protein